MLKLFTQLKKVVLYTSLLTLGFTLCSFKFQESKLAHKYLDGLVGIEIGASAHNPFGLKAINVDFEDNPNSIFRKEQIELCGTFRHIDVVASGDNLPFKDNSVDFVVCSHVLEHFYDPIKAVEEWLRVTRPGGYIFMIIPHKQRMFDYVNQYTMFEDLIERHEFPTPMKIDIQAHHCFWTTTDFLELCTIMGWNVVDWRDKDDKVGNGFMIVLQNNK